MNSEHARTHRRGQVCKYFSPTWFPQTCTGGPGLVSTSNISPYFTKADTSTRVNVLRRSSEDAMIHLQLDKISFEKLDMKESKVRWLHNSSACLIPILASHLRLFKSFDQQLLGFNSIPKGNNIPIFNVLCAHCEPSKLHRAQINWAVSAKPDLQVAEAVANEKG